MLEDLLQEAFSAPKEEIGNREEIVGSSDLTCAWKAYHAKLYPKKKTLQQLNVLTRGDGREWKVWKAMQWLHARGRLGQGSELFSQLELVHPEIDYIMAHLDITVTNSKTVSILEVKSTAALPDVVYPGWFYQGTLQMGLARMLYPGKSIRCTILAFNELTGEHRMYVCGTDWQFDENIFNQLIEKAKTIRTAVQAQDPTGLQQEPSVLCSYCEYAHECPAIWPDAEEPLSLISHDELIAQHVIANENYSKAKKERARLKSQLDAFMVQANGGTLPKVAFGRSHVFDVKREMRSTNQISSEKLQAKYPEVYADEEIRNKSTYPVFTVKPRKDLVVEEEETKEKGTSKKAPKKRTARQAKDKKVA